MHLEVSFVAPAMAQIGLVNVMCITLGRMRRRPCIDRRLSA